MNCCVDRLKQDYSRLRANALAPVHLTKDTLNIQYPQISPQFSRLLTSRLTRPVYGDLYSTRIGSDLGGMRSYRDRQAQHLP